jgi:hypothetical protein
MSFNPCAYTSGAAGTVRFQLPGFSGQLARPQHASTGSTAAYAEAPVDEV